MVSRVARLFTAAYVVPALAAARNSDEKVMGSPQELDFFRMGWNRRDYSTAKTSLFTSVASVVTGTDSCSSVALTRAC